MAILDISTPEMTCIEVSRNTVNAGLRNHAVLLTIPDDPCAVLEAQEAGVAGFILKGSSFEDFVTAVRTVAAGSTFVPPLHPEKAAEIAVQRTGCRVAVRART